MSTHRATESNAPLISIITPTLNAEAFLQACLASVDVQRDEAIEHVVVDGGSTDRTLSILAAMPGSRILAQKAEGLYHALNEGLAAALGRYVLFLNADDLLLPGAIDAIRGPLGTSERIDVLYGPVCYVNADGDEQTRCGIAGSGLALETLCFGVPALNAKLFRRDCLLAVGGFDTKYAIAGDRAMLLRLARTGPSYRAIGQPLTAYRRHPSSITLDMARRNRLAIRREHVRLAWDLIAESPSRGPERALLADWQALERARLIVGTLLSGGLGGAMRHLGAGLITQPLWPFRAVRAVPKGWRVRRMGQPTSAV